MNGRSSDVLAGVTIVTYNSAAYIRNCLDWVFRQDYPRFQVVVVDNASKDGTPEILREFTSRVRVICNRENVGFAAGQNQAIGLSDADWILTLNPDVRLTPGFLSAAIAAGESDESIGSVCGKLLAMPPDFSIPESPVFDSTGIYVTPNMRHFDRGSKMRDTGQFDAPEYVFGVTGAAALYRRSMIRDISIDGEFFDSSFFAYREDADVSWRAQLLGWKCFYAPSAVAYHVRNVLPSNRHSVSAAINMHSVKNRWLLRIKNMTGHLYVRHLLAITVRDLTVIAGCLLREWSSLPAFAIVARQWRRTWAKRRQIMRRRQVSDEYIESWFSNRPVSYAAPEVAARMSMGVNRG